jgi:hypothetical protein
MNDQFPCKCGHPRQWHERLLPHDDVDICLRCHAMPLPPREWAAYHYYEPDNLKFLEQEYEKFSQKC